MNLQSTTMTMKINNHFSKISLCKPKSDFTHPLWRLLNLFFSAFTKVLAFAILLFIFQNCSKPTWDNPFDEKNTLSANDWKPESVKIEVLSITKHKIVWDYNPKSITGFRIDRKFNNEEWEIAYAQVNAESRFWIDSLIEPILNATYTYRIQAFADGYVSGAVSLVDTVSIPAPKNLIAQKMKESSYLLTWVDQSIGEQGFIIDRKRGENPWEIGYDSVSANVQEYTDNNVFKPKSNLDVSYRISAWYGQNRSKPTEINLAAMLTPPNNVLITPLGQQRVIITWEDVSTGEEGYRIERKASNGNWELIAILEENSTSVEDPGALWLSTPQRYCITAFNGNFNSTSIESEIVGPQVVTLQVDELSMRHLTLSSSLSTTGNYQVSERGICWGMQPNPTISDNSQVVGSGTGSYTTTLTGLQLGTAYYFRSYAKHPFGVAYNSAILVNTPPACGGSFEVAHDTTKGAAPINKTVTYGTTFLNGLPNMCFITSNLGASRTGLAADDTTEMSAGWYWQFNTLQGYKHNGKHRTPAISWPPAVTLNTNWAPANDPCTNELGVDWRLPTYTELNTALMVNSWQNSSDVYNSALKLHNSGALNYDTGNKIISFGGIYSNTKVDEYQGFYLHFSPTSARIGLLYNSNALTIRCIRDESIK